MHLFPNSGDKKWTLALRNSSCKLALSCKTCSSRPWSEGHYFGISNLFNKAVKLCESTVSYTTLLDLHL